MRSVTAKVILILLLWSTAAFCQDFNVYPFSMIDYSFLGVGARARAMGGAFIGVSDDASALTWNPAGLIQVDKTQASISGVYLPLQLETKLSFADDATRNIDAKYKDEKLKPTFASFVAPVRIKSHPFMASVTYSALQDQLNEEYNMSYLIYGASDGQRLYVGDASRRSRYNTEGGLDKVSLGFGTALYGDLAFGGSVNIFTGSSKARYYGAFLDSGGVYNGSVFEDSVYVRGVVNVQDTSSTAAFNFTASLFYHKDKFRAGLVVSTPFELTTEHDLMRADTLYTRSMAVNAVEIPTANRPSLYRGKTKIEIPADISLGLSYQVTPNFLLAGDVEYADFSKSQYYVRAEVDSQTQLSSLDYLNTFTLAGSVYYFVPWQGSYYTSDGKLEEVFNIFDLGLDKATQFRFGGEYTLKTSGGTIPIRAGVRIAQGPYREVTQLVRDEDGEPQFDSTSGEFVLGDKVTRTVFAFGTGIHWRQIWLDFAAEVNGEKQTETGTAEYGAYTTEKKKTAVGVHFNFTGFF